jgi:hypothetical protein
MYSNFCAEFSDGVERAQGNADNLDIFPSKTRGALAPTAITPGRAKCGCVSIRFTEGSTTAIVAVRGRGVVPRRDGDGRREKSASDVRNEVPVRVEFHTMSGNPAAGGRGEHEVVGR